MRTLTTAEIDLVAGGKSKSKKVSSSAGSSAGIGVGGVVGGGTLQTVTITGTYQPTLSLGGPPQSPYAGWGIATAGGTLGSAAGPWVGRAIGSSLGLVFTYLRAHGEGGTFNCDPRVYASSGNVYPMK